MSARRLGQVEHSRSHQQHAACVWSEHTIWPLHCHGYAKVMLITRSYHITTTLRKHTINTHAGPRMQSVK